MLQLVVLGVTCAWQLSHLRAFFIKQKLTGDCAIDLGSICLVASKADMHGDSIDS